MSSKSSEKPPPTKRVRLLPWRGPVHFGLLMITSAVSLMLPLLYIAALLAFAGYLGWIGWQWTHHLAFAENLAWDDALPLGFLAGGIVTWIFMLRPLLPQRRRAGVALLITPASQPGIYELVDELCWHLKLDPVEEIWLDTTVSIRTSVKDGVIGVSSGQMILNIGLPVVSVTSAREFAALLVRELAMNAGGIGTTFSHLVRELNTWFYRALLERDPWEMDLRQARKKETRFQKFIRSVTWLWMTVAKVLFAVFFVIARVVNAAALMRLESGAAAAARNLIGREAWDMLQTKMGLLDKAWESSTTEIRRGMGNSRLPENLSLLLARHVARAARELSAAEIGRAHV